VIPFGRNHLGLHTGGLVSIEGVGKRIFVASGEGALIRHCTSRCRRRGVSQVALGGGLVGAVLLGQDDRETREASGEGAIKAGSRE
jgi:hypothetical protein